MIILRTICCIGVVLCALFLPFWIFVCVALAYILVYTPYEILVLAVGMDAQFGNPTYDVIPLYTIATTLIMVSSLYLKPRLRFYN